MMTTRWESQSAGLSDGNDICWRCWKRICYSLTCLIVCYYNIIILDRRVTEGVLQFGRKIAALSEVAVRSMRQLEQPLSQRQQLRGRWPVIRPPPEQYRRQRQRQRLHSLVRG